jgi:hypothetical protein
MVLYALTGDSVSVNVAAATSAISSASMMVRDRVEQYVASRLRVVQEDNSNRQRKDRCEDDWRRHG